MLGLNALWSIASTPVSAGSALLSGVQNAWKSVVQSDSDKRGKVHGEISGYADSAMTTYDKSIDLSKKHRDFMTADQSSHPQLNSSSDISPQLQLERTPRQLDQPPAELLHNESDEVFRTTPAGIRRAIQFFRLLHGGKSFSHAPSPAFALKDDAGLACLDLSQGSVEYSDRLCTKFDNMQVHFNKGALNHTSGGFFGSASSEKTTQKESEARSSDHGSRAQITTVNALSFTLVPRHLVFSPQLLSLGAWLGQSLEWTESPEICNQLMEDFVEEFGETFQIDGLIGARLLSENEHATSQSSSTPSTSTSASLGSDNEAQSSATNGLIEHSKDSKEVNRINFGGGSSGHLEFASKTTRLNQLRVFQSGRTISLLKMLLRVKQYNRSLEHSGDIQSIIMLFVCWGKMNKKYLTLFTALNGFAQDSEPLPESVLQWVKTSREAYGLSERQNGPRHQGVRCTACRAQDMYVLYKCSNCASVDVCGPCFVDNVLKEQERMCPHAASKFTLIDPPEA